MDSHLSILHATPNSMNEGSADMYAKYNFN